MLLCNQNPAYFLLANWEIREHGYPLAKYLTMLGENVSVCSKIMAAPDKNLGTNNLTVPGYYVMDNVVKTG